MKISNLFLLFCEKAAAPRSGFFVLSFVLSFMQIKIQYFTMQYNPQVHYSRKERSVPCRSAISHALAHSASGMHGS